MMPGTDNAIPLQTLSRPPATPPLPAGVRVKNGARRSASLPAQPSRRGHVARSASFYLPHEASGNRKEMLSRAGNAFSADQANAFLRKAGLGMALRGDRLAITRHRDLEAAEAQRPPSIGDLAHVCKALMLAEDTPAKLEVAKALLPVISRQLLEQIEADTTAGNLRDKAVALAKRYCTILGGRDLAIDDTIATINAYFFDRIGEDKALNGANIAAAALTATFMLVPTVGKNLPALVAALREGRYRDAVMPALSICAIAGMTLNPTMAALGVERASAIAAATGNTLMMCNLPEIAHHAREWASLRRALPDPETRPFAAFARSHGLVDKGLHTALDFLHEFAAQAGFLALNLKNAIGGSDSPRNPAVFPLLSVLLGSFALDTARGEQPFTEFRPDRESLASDVTVQDGAWVRQHAARLLLQQKISGSYRPADYNAFMRPLIETSSAKAHIARQLGGNTLSDAQEKAFLKGLLCQFCADEDARDAVRVAIERIYRFDRFDPAANAGGDPALCEILRFVQAERNKDKAFLRDGRGLAHADHVYRNVIAHAIKCALFEELGQTATGSGHD